MIFFPFLQSFIIVSSSIIACCSLVLRIWLSLFVKEKSNLWPPCYLIVQSFSFKNTWDFPFTVAHSNYFLKAKYKTYMLFLSHLFGYGMQVLKRNIWKCALGLTTCICLDMFSSFYISAQILLTPLTNTSLAQFATNWSLSSLYFTQFLPLGIWLLGLSSNHSSMFISPFIHFSYQ
jgi:hypothetical protein